MAEQSEDARDPSRTRSSTPEEVRAGTDVPREQAQAILEDSEARQEDREAAPGTSVEHRTSESTVSMRPD